MCNRYTPARGADLMHDLFGRVQVNFPPKRIGPFGDAPFLRRAPDGRLEEVVGQWGMIRPGAPARRELAADKRPRMTNNARSETMHKLVTYRDAWTKGRRCLIPAWGFDEPNYDGTKKNTWWEMRRADGAPWAIAGLWSEWLDRETGEVVPSFTMPTVCANLHPLLVRMHKDEPLPLDKRSVVPLAPDVWDAWLAAPVDEARLLLTLPGTEAFAAGPVPTATPSA